MSFCRSKFAVRIFCNAFNIAAVAIVHNVSSLKEYLSPTVHLEQGDVSSEILVSSRTKLLEGVINKVLALRLFFSLAWDSDPTCMPLPVAGTDSSVYKAA